MRICIFGASGRELDARYYAEAEATGRLIGENGDSIVFGGGAGTMLQPYTLLVVRSGR